MEQLSLRRTIRTPYNVGSVNFFKLEGTMRLSTSGNATSLPPVPVMGSST